MQKRWKYLVALVMVLVLIFVSVCAEENASDSDPAASVKTAETETTLPDDENAATGETEKEEASAPSTEKPAADEKDKSAALPTPGEKEEDQEGESTGMPASDDADESENTPVPDVMGETQETVPVVTDPPASERETWVAINISLNNRHRNDELANAAMLKAQFLLARAVADGETVGLYRIRKQDQEAFEGAITTPDAWENLMQKLDTLSCNGKGSNEAINFSEFVTNFAKNKPEKKLKNAALWILHTEPRMSTNKFASGEQTIKSILNESGAEIHFVRFQKKDAKLERDAHWIDERLAELGGENFLAEPYVYDSPEIQNTVKVAMETFGLNLLAPYTKPPQKDENGLSLWEHKGLDTLLILTTEGDITVAADAQLQPGAAFPLVMKTGPNQHMVLLRNVAPGTYRIKGEVEKLYAAYHIEKAEMKLVEPPDEGSKWEWYLEEKTLDVSLDVPQLKAGDVELKVFINNEPVECLKNQNPNDESETVPSWTITIPRQPLNEEGTSNVLTIEARVDDETSWKIPSVFQKDTDDLDEKKPGVPETKEQPDEGKLAAFVVLSPEYTFTVIDRPLTLAGAAEKELVYYYNVPGQMETPLTEEMWQYFNNEDEQPLNYTVKMGSAVVAENELIYMRGENEDAHQIVMDVCDGVSAPVEFTVNIMHVDVLEMAAAWKCAEYSTTEYKGELGEPAFLRFNMPAEAAEQYGDVRKQYPELPEKLSEALVVSAKLCDDEGNHDPMIVDVTEQEDGSILLTLEVPKYDRKVEANITFEVMLQNKLIPDQKILPDCAFEVENDSPKLAEGVAAELTLKTSIQGTPGQRVPLTLDELNALQSAQQFTDGNFVPANLFSDMVSLHGLQVEIKAEPANLVTITDTNGEAVPCHEGVWTFGYELSKDTYRLAINDKGTVKLEISAHDGENPGEQSIVWTINVQSPFDLTVLVVSIAAGILLVTLVVLLILRQVRKPSFARMNSVMSMRMSGAYGSNQAYTEVPMRVYGKKETDLAKLFIACQQAPAMSLPMSILADIALQPGKRNTYRLVLGKHAENVSVVVGDQAQNTQKPVVFNQDEMVRIYVDMNEVLYMYIGTGRW